jgi:hypothetical protein
MSRSLAPHQPSSSHFKRVSVGISQEGRLSGMRTFFGFRVKLHELGDQFCLLSQVRRREDHKPFSFFSS